MQIKDTEHYSELMEKFREKLLEKIPDHEDATVNFTRTPEIVMQYGPSAVVVVLQTNSSGVDKYIVYVGHSQKAQFIRIIE